MNITKKIKLVIINDNKDIVKEQYKFIRDSQYAQYQGLNRCMGYLMSGYYSVGMNIKDERFKQHQKTITNSMPILEGIEFGKGIDSKSAITQKVKQDFSTALKNGLAKGERSVANYKRTFPLMTRGRSLQFYYEGKDVYIKWINGIVFKCILGDNKNRIELEHSLRKAINGEWKVGGSSLQFDKNNKLMLNLNLSIPDRKREVVEGRCLGVDVGLAIPAYVSVSGDIYVRNGFGKYEEFAKVRLQFKKRRERLYKQKELVKGGKGRKRKLHSMEYLRDKESNFAKTYNHQLSRKIVDFAIKNQCEYIKLEKINSDTLEDKLLGMWGYSQLQEQIKYKAEMLGIKVLFVNPVYTSQKCHCCGNIDENNRPKDEKGQWYFKCTNPKCKMSKKPSNADWNASINIARSTDIVKSK